MGIAEYLTDLAVGLFVQHVEIGVDLGRDADRERLPLTVIEGRVIHLRADQECRLSVASALVDPWKIVPRWVL